MTWATAAYLLSAFCVALAFPAALGLVELFRWKRRPFTKEFGECVARELMAMRIPLKVRFETKTVVDRRECKAYGYTTMYIYLPTWALGSQSEYFSDSLLDLATARARQKASVAAIEAAVEL